MELQSGGARLVPHDADPPVPGRRRRGALFIERPVNLHRAARRSNLQWTARDLLRAIGVGILDGNIDFENAEGCREGARINR